MDIQSQQLMLGMKVGTSLKYRVRCCLRWFIKRSTNVSSKAFEFDESKLKNV